MVGYGSLSGAVIAVAGAGGPADARRWSGSPRLGAVVVGADKSTPERLAEAVDAARYAGGGATVTGETVDLLDLADTRAWAARIEKDHGRIKRPGPPRQRLAWRRDLQPTPNLADWDLLEKLSVRTVQQPRSPSTTPSSAATADGTCS